MESTEAPRGSVVLDLDGVVYLGSTPIPGAAATISNLIRGGWQVLFATNNSTKTARSISEVIASRTGLSIDPGTVVTSGMAAAEYLLDEGVATALVVGSSQLSDTVSGAGISVIDSQSVEAVVVGLDTELTHGTITKASAAIRDGAIFVATNTDATLPTPDGLVPGAGTVVAAIAAASDAYPVVCGKPHDPMVRLIDRMLESDRVWMVGDRPETDVAFARAAGWRSVLALTGVTSQPENIPPALTPDHVIASIVGLEGVLTEAVGAEPNEG
jgi:HAD superfamily hydrolase (TIGR01450 family)